MEMLLAIVILVFSAILHEVMHGVVADKLGDPTPRLMGRLTLNPIPHIDPLSSIIIPALLILSGSPIIFGAAKPVPVNPLHLSDGKKDLALVALSGPLTNILLAAAASFFLKILFEIPILSDIFYNIVLYNLILGIINLIPIPPLDGSKVFSIILPEKLSKQYMSIEPFGIFILIFLLLFPFGPLSLGGVINSLLFFSLKLLGLDNLSP